MRPAHEVYVTADQQAPVAERFLAVCTCESDDTSPQPTLAAALDDGARHLDEAHGLGIEALWVDTAPVSV